MKIKKIGWTSFLITTPNISVITDPLKYVEEKKGFPKTSADISIFTKYEKEIKGSILKDTGLSEKVTPEHRKEVFEIFTPGEYELSGIIIRRSIDTDFYIIDENSLRVVYMGGTDSTFKVDNIKDLGDVDVLILPVGDGVNFMSFDTMEKVISDIDPAVLIPCAFSEDGAKGNSFKSKEEFIKHFGFANVREETTLNVVKKKVDEEEQQSVEVVFLQ